MLKKINRYKEAKRLSLIIDKMTFSSISTDTYHVPRNYLTPQNARMLFEVYHKLINEPLYETKHDSEPQLLLFLKELGFVSYRGRKLQYGYVLTSWDFWGYLKASLITTRIINKYKI